MQQQDIEIKIWAYIDGTLDAQEQTSIAQQIAADAAWKEVYQQLSAINDMLGKEEILEHPSMRFTQNVMDEVAHTLPASKGSSLARNWYVRAFVLFFVTVMLLCTGSLFFLPQPQAATRDTFTSLIHINQNTVYIAALINAVILFFLADGYKMFRSSRGA